MIMKLFRALSARRAASVTGEVAAVASLAPVFAGMDDVGLREAAAALKARVAAGADLASVRAEAFALVREASQRVLGQRPYDVQVHGAAVMARGSVAEMKTGEGKTLTSVMPAFLFALEGRGVHVVTVNDYLARRDADGMGPVLAFLGMTAGCVQSSSTDPERRAAYACDVTWCANSELGFDTLRDNLRFSEDQRVMRGHRYAIVDEADSVLIDEARMPLVISAPSGTDSGAYLTVAGLVSALDPASDWIVDEKEKSVVLTESGAAKVEAGLVGAGLLAEASALYEGPASFAASRLVDAALKARALFVQGRDYVIVEGRAVIVDPSTGRAMEGRRYSEGVHEAIEAREGLEVKPETQPLTSITYQNLFRGYAFLAGMTGTASTEREEFGAVYGLDVETVPTNVPVARVDHDDVVFMTSSARDAAVADAVEEAHAAGRPVLVGTGSVEASERVAAVLAARGWKQDVGAGPQPPRTWRMLNARNHLREAETVASAGLPGAVMIATNMAGRGTDIKLGGEAGGAAAAAARQAGGLLVLGVGRNESRRVDDQLRGRSGRQGDPGASRFYVSLDDDLVRVYATEKTKRMVRGLGLGEDDALSHPLVSKMVAAAQQAVEARNYETRRNVVKYDDVVDQQRRAVQALRGEAMGTDDVRETVRGMVANSLERTVSRFVPADSFPEMWDVEGLAKALYGAYRLEAPVAAWAAEEGVDGDVLADRVLGAGLAVLDEAERGMPASAMRRAEKMCLMHVLDSVWRQHLGVLEELRAAVGLRTVAQRDPMVEFRTDAYELFERTMEALADGTAGAVLRIRAVPQGAAEAA